VSYELLDNKLKVVDHEANKDKVLQQLIHIVIAFWRSKESSCIDEFGKKSERRIHGQFVVQHTIFISKRGQNYDRLCQKFV